MGINKKIKIILCGGGTGGHIFPMLSITTSEYGFPNFFSQSKAFSELSL